MDISINLLSIADFNHSKQLKKCPQKLDFCLQNILVCAVSVFQCGRKNWILWSHSEPKNGDSKKIHIFHICIDFRIQGSDHNCFKEMYDFKISDFFLQFQFSETTVFPYSTKS